MIVAVHPFVANLTDALDKAVLKRAPEFSELPTFNRRHFLLKYLQRLKIVEGEKCGSRKVKYWNLAPRYRKLLGLNQNYSQNFALRIDAPIVINTLADEFDEFLRDNERVKRIALSLACRIRDGAKQ